MNMKQRKIKIEPRIKLNYKICITNRKLNVSLDILINSIVNIFNISLPYIMYSHLFIFSL